MKKSISLIIFFLLSILSINAQCWIAHKYDFKNFSDLEKTDLQGKIEIVMFSHYDVNNSFGEISKGNKKCEQEVLFNEDGSVNKITNYESNGGIDDIEIHEYENGEIKLISKYNNKGTLVSKTAFIKDSLEIREQLFSSGGSLNDQYFLRSYDLKGNMIKEEWRYHKEPKKSDKTQFYFDKNNRVIKYTRNGDDTFIISYKDNYSKIPFKIDRLDPVTKKFKLDESHEFNSQGNIIKEFDKGKLSRSYEYIYDNKGNWIEKIVFQSEAKIPYEIIERKIYYFK
jgi:hypothetical protein